MMIHHLFKMIQMMKRWKMFLILSVVGLVFEMINIQLWGWGRKWVIDALSFQDQNLFIRGMSLVILFSIIAPASIIMIDYNIYKRALISKYDIKRNIIKCFLFSNTANELESGDLLYRVNNDINTISEIYGVIYLTIASIGRTVGAVVIGMQLSRELIGFIILLGIVKLIIEKHVIKKLHDVLNAIKETESLFVDELYKMLKGNVFVRIFGNRNRFRENFNQLSQEFYESNLKEAKIDNQIDVINWLLNVLTLMTIIILGSILIIYEKMTIGTLVAFLGLHGALLDPYRYFGMLIKQYSHSYTSYERIREILQRNEEKVTKESTPWQYEKPKDFQLVVENIGFRYEKNKPLLEHLSFRAKSGEITYIQGRSGAGKTTLFKIFLGLLPIDYGDIYLEDPKKRKIPLNKKWITYISQNNYIFNGTIGENITFGWNVDQEKLIEVSKKAGIYDYICSLPEGFDAVVYDNGKEMSAGQRSRICLARAFYRKSSVLLLDEVFASLDDTTIKHILASLKASLDEETCGIMITHRREHVPEDAAVISF